jgi:hypothetical protein
MRLAMGYLATCVKGIILHKFTRTNDFMDLASLLRNFFAATSNPRPI